MHPSLTPYLDLIKTGMLKAHESQSYIGFNYTDKCTFKGEWNYFTRRSRGIIFDKNTGECIAKPLDKFHNLFENQDTTIDKLPKLDFIVQDKLDGSAIILYRKDGKYRCATRGSFDSEQSQWAEEILKDRYDLSNLPDHLTLVWELIHPHNKIVVDYKGDKDLYLIAVFDRVSQQELLLDDEKKLAKTYGFRMPQIFDLQLEDIIKQRDLIDKNKEGWVVRYENGYRVKIKGSAYLAMAKLIAHLTPLAVWEVMEMGNIPDPYISSYPEELRSELDVIIEELRLAYNSTTEEIQADIKKLPQGKKINDQYRKEVGLFIKDHSGEFKHPRIIFPMLLGHTKKIDYYIKKFIKPVGNVYKEDI